MTWQEYQEAVAIFYENLDDLGTVHRSTTIPDKVTRHPRQIDVLIDIEAYGQVLQVLIDAKFRAEKIDVKDVEEVMALADAVNASQIIIVAANSWTDPAARKAKSGKVSLKLLTLDEALDLLVPDKWEMCPKCMKDCIVLDLDGAEEYGSGSIWWLAGSCRECGYGVLWCQNCGETVDLIFDDVVRCGCGHFWKWVGDGLRLRFVDEEAEPE
jgi:Restriction endonuclease